MEWIKCLEQMPTVGVAGMSEPVLVADKWGGIHLTYYSKADNGFVHVEQAYSDTSIGGEINQGVTHWQALPEPPKQD